MSESFYPVCRDTLEAGSNNNDNMEGRFVFDVAPESFAHNLGGRFARFPSGCVRREKKRSAYDGRSFDCFPARGDEEERTRNFRIDSQIANYENEQTETCFYDPSPLFSETMDADHQSEYRTTAFSTSSRYNYRDSRIDSYDASSADRATHNNNAIARTDNLICIPTPIYPGTQSERDNNYRKTFLASLHATTTTTTTTTYSLSIPSMLTSNVSPSLAKASTTTSSIQITSTTESAEAIRVGSDPFITMETPQSISKQIRKVQAHRARPRAKRKESPYVSQVKFSTERGGGLLNPEEPSSAPRHSWTSWSVEDGPPIFCEGQAWCWSGNLR